MDFSSMSGWDFERYCADCLLKKGFTKAEVTSGSGDHGVDIIAEQNGIRFGVQCKLYQGQIPNKAVQEAYTGASYYDCDVAVIMSNSELTRQAQEEARKLRVRFWKIADYMSEDDKEANPKDCMDSRPTEINTYEDYCLREKLREEQIDLQIQEEFSHTTQVKLAVQNPYAQKCMTLKKSKAWLDFGRWQTLRSIECFCEELKSLSGTREQILLEKLSYVEKLQISLSNERDMLKYASSNLCLEIDQRLRWDADGSMPITEEKEFNEKYWTARYIYEQVQNVASNVYKIFEKFSLDELRQIESTKPSWDVLNTDFKNELGRLKKSLSALMDEWEMLVAQEEDVWNLWTFWKSDTSIIAEIRYHKELIRDTKKYLSDKKLIKHLAFSTRVERIQYLEDIYRERQTFAVLLRILLMKKGREEIAKRRKQQEQKEKELREKLEKKEIARREQERLFKEKQEAERKEREIQLKEKQEAERNALIQSLIDCYNTECSKIDSEVTAARNGLESRAQNEIAQAQKQIGDLLKKKQSFTFFRKERDAKTDATIATIERHIEQLKKQLECDIVKYDSEAQEKIKALQEQTLGEAEKGGVKEEVLKKIN